MPELGTTSSRFRMDQSEERKTFNRRRRAFLFEAIVSRQFRTEIEALCGYDTDEIGKIRP